MEKKEEFHTNIFELLVAEGKELQNPNVHNGDLCTPTVSEITKDNNNITAIDNVNDQLYIIEDNDKEQVSKCENSGLAKGDQEALKFVAETSIELNNTSNLRKRNWTETSVSCELKSASSIPNQLSEGVDEVNVPRKRSNRKVTFASMQKNIREKLECQERLEQMFAQRKSLTAGKATFTDEQKKSILKISDGTTANVNVKDPLPLLKYNMEREIQLQHRRGSESQDDVITQILKWSNLWLENRNVEAYAVSQKMNPIPNIFTDSTQYQNIILPLMKIEYMTSIQETPENIKYKSYWVKKESILVDFNRLIIVAKYESTPGFKYINYKYDMVVINFGNKYPVMCAYTTYRKEPDYYILTFEIIGDATLKRELRDIIHILVFPILENIHVYLAEIQAINRLKTSPLCRKILNPLKLTGRKHQFIKKLESIKYNGYDKLNEHQSQALFDIYAKIIKNEPDISLIQGPPGTGKSYVITNLALQCLYGDEVPWLGKKILICAPSNMATDILARKLVEIKCHMKPESEFKLIRHGILEKMHPDMQKYSLQKCVEQEIVKRKQNEIAELVDDESETNMSENETLELQNLLILNANIVCTTLSSCITLSRFIHYFDVCIIDEATQCTEPMTLLPLIFGITNLILVGDVQQLPATVKSMNASALGFGKSMFTRIQECFEKANDKDNIIYSLNKQYRMHPEICLFPNLHFYKNKLINAVNTQKYSTPILPFCVINLTYEQDENCQYGRIKNVEEARFVMQLLTCLTEYLPTKYYTYGVITPYAMHRDILADAIKKQGFRDIMVNTVDSYQGHERDVIIISNARTCGIGFLSSPQRLNVALTRAKHCLILCGNFRDLESNDLWRELLTNARERKLYFELNAITPTDMRKNIMDTIRVPTQKNNETVNSELSSDIEELYF